MSTKEISGNYARHSKEANTQASPPELKRQIVAACQQPGASVAGIALAHGLNANLVRRWLKQGQCTGYRRDIRGRFGEPWFTKILETKVTRGSDTV